MSEHLTRNRSASRYAPEQYFPGMNVSNGLRPLTIADAEMVATGKEWFLRKVVHSALHLLEVEARIAADSNWAHGGFVCVPDIP